MHNYEMWSPPVLKLSCHNVLNDSIFILKLSNCRERYRERPALVFGIYENSFYSWKFKKSFGVIRNFWSKNNDTNVLWFHYQKKWLSLHGNGSPEVSFIVEHNSPELGTRDNCCDNIGHRYITANYCVEKLHFDYEGKHFLYFSLS